MPDDPKPPGYHSKRWYLKHPKVSKPAAMSKSTMTPEPSPLPLIVFKIITFISLLLSGAGFVLGIYFWWATAFMYVVFIVSAFDIWLEPGLRKRTFIRILGILIILALTVLFTVGIVIRPAPLLVKGRGYMGGYKGTKVANIDWKPEYSDVRAVFRNDTEQDYTKLDIVLSPNPHSYLIAAFGQNTNMPGVTILNTEQGSDQIHITNRDKSGNPTGEEFTQDSPGVSFFTGTIRVLCDRLPKHTVLEIVMAVVNTNIR